MEIVKYDSISQSQILENLEQYKNSLPNANDMKDNLDSSTTQFVMQMMSGVSAWLLYQLNMNRKETYLFDAVKDSSIYTISRVLGYNISRPLCPKVKVRYTGVPTLVLKCGDIIGSCNDYDVIYFGASKIIEKGDEITLDIGKYKESYGVIQDNIDVTGNTKKIAPTELKYIDDNQIRLTIKNREYHISKSVEDFVVFKTPVDFSIDEKSTNIYIRDIQYRYGLYEIPNGSEYKISFIETDGAIDGLGVSDISLEGEYLALEIETTGTAKESTSKIKENVPFYFSTMRRAVTTKDHTYLCKAHSLVQDALCVKEEGTKGQWKVVLKNLPIEPGEQISIGISLTNVYRVTAIENESRAELLKRLAKTITLANWATAKTIDDEEAIVITNNDARVKMNIIVSSNFEEPEILVNNVEPPCCTINVYYIRSGQSRSGEIQNFTDNEQIVYAEYIKTFKLTGLSVILMPATRIQYDITLKITLADSEVKIDDITIMEYVQKEARKILEKSYEYRISHKFNYYEFVAAVAQIEALVEGEVTYPVKSIEPVGSDENPIRDIQLSESEYLVVPNLEIKFED